MYGYVYGCSYYLSPIVALNVFLLRTNANRVNS